MFFFYYIIKIKKSQKFNSAKSCIIFKKSRAIFIVIFKLFSASEYKFFHAASVKCCGFFGVLNFGGCLANPVIETSIPEEISAKLSSLKKLISNSSRIKLNITDKGK